MKKREFLKITSVVAAGSLVLPLSSGCNSTKNSQSVSTLPVFELPKLGYEYNALEPYIDAQTMEIHYSKHHAGYTKKFNEALAKSADMAGKTIEEIFATLTSQEKDASIRNNGGGFYNHQLFWSVMSPNAGGNPSGDIGDAINATFGSYEKFKKDFSGAAKGVFGSGWAWLCKDKNNKLFISSTPNQDNPLMTNLVAQQGTPILGLDVWEHAYYLKYQNLRADYINNFFNVVNWNAVNANLVGKKG
jgi:superoxide dismutase, Fe-Mn family